MTIVVERAEFRADRQFLDVAVEVPDRAPGWSVVLRAEGAQPFVSTRYPCLANGKGPVRMRIYPFLDPGSYTLFGRLLAPESGAEEPRTESVAHKPANLGRATVPAVDEANAASWLHGDDIDLCQAASRSLVPLCFTPDGTPCFWPLQGASERRVVVLSIPKAGTYLFANLLTNLGIVSCNVHVGQGLVGDYRASTRMPPPVQRHMDVAFSSRLVLPGQSMASHMKRALATQVALHPYAKIFVYRDLRAALTSAFRTGARRVGRMAGEGKSGAAEVARQMPDSPQGFVTWLQHGHLERMRKQYDGAAAWHGHPGVHAVSFEDVMGDAGPEKQHAAALALAETCGVAITEAQAQAALSKSIGADTQTYSGARTKTDTYWTADAEELFAQAGLADLNRKLGFAAP